MGLRGCLPNITIKSEPLQDLTPPLWLEGEGRACWLRHCEQLAENHLLTETTQDAFANLCRVSHLLADYREKQPDKTYFDLMKTWERLAKPFRLLPMEKPHVKETDRFADFGEVDV